MYLWIKVPNYDQVTYVLSVGNHHKPPFDGGKVDLVFPNPTWIAAVIIGTCMYMDFG